MDWWTEVRLAMASFLDQHGLLAAFVFLLIEEAGVPVPVPGDFVMLILGVRARRGDIPVWQAIGVMELATVIGATFLYAAARLAGGVPGPAGAGAAHRDRRRLRRLLRADVGVRASHGSRRAAVHLRLHAA